MPDSPSINLGKYHQIFEQLSSQKEIFETVARPVVNSVLNGFNGTIFAYGQTGSGKTYSITGCPKIYDNRGIIPRSIEQIFDYLHKNPEAYTVHLSYLEIYNEIGYDLLNPKQMASKLEELPRVILLEDGKGVAHLRNLSVHPVSTEKDAMRLLFLGDTNRTIAETPMNDYSSRSHCIFTVYLTSQLKRNNKTVKSKLHVVDLAGSERIGKSSITGNILNDAKNINLSLHYLEQVISALSSSKKHVPFRNSMLTYLLKDSLCGNSLTTMLATLAVTKRNIEETISTCRFSKRVSMITTQPIINEEEFDSQEEINILQNEIFELKTKLSKYEGYPKSYDRHSLPKEDELGERKQEHYRNKVEEFLDYKIDVIDLTLSEMKYCMELMRDMCRDKNLVDADLPVKSELEKREHKANNPAMNIKDSRLLPKERNYSKNIKQKSEREETPPISRSKQKHVEEIEDYHDKLKKAYEEAKSKSEVIEKCRQNIIILRTKMDQHRNLKIKEQLVAELYRQQDAYRKTILELRELEKETDHLKFGLLQSEMKKRRGSSSIPLNLGNEVTKPFDHYETLEDYNRPEKENEGTQTLLTLHGQNCSTSPLEKTSGESYSFLQMLADEGCTLGKDQLGLPPERDEPLGKNWYQNDGESLPPTSKLQGVNSWGNKYLEANFVAQNLDSYRDQKPKSSRVRNTSRKNSREPDKIPRKYSTIFEQDLNRCSITKLAEENSQKMKKSDGLFEEEDSSQFKEFMKSVPLTGDKDVDEEIISFYRSKFNN